MMRTFLGPLAVAGVLAFSFLGCNSILSNEKGVLLEADEAGILPEAPDSSSPVDALPPPLTDAGKDSGEKPSANCPAGQQECFGTCVSMTDPLYGCGSPSCSACPSTHATMGCQGRTCIVKTCNPGYADCNASGADGCEVDLSKSVSCGTCNAKCGAAAPLCTPSGPSFQCTNGCTPVAPVACGAECVDPTISTNHCGSCNIKCPAVENGTEECKASTCGFTCKPQFHACAGKCPAKTDPMTCGAACTPCPVPAGGTATCVNDTCGIACTAPSHACGAKCIGVGAADNDPLACGALCTVCPVPANGSATCTGGGCGVACSAGFGNCNGIAADGCEANFANDAANCGMCGKSCGAQACVAGVCNP